MNPSLVSNDKCQPLVGYALSRWTEDCATDHSLGSKEHQLPLHCHLKLPGAGGALGPSYQLLGFLPN